MNKQVKKKRTGVSIARLIEQADVCWLLQAVAETRIVYDSDGREAGAAHWEWDTRHHRPNMIADVEARYRELSGNRGPFPFHGDYVVHLWIKCRKEEAKVISELRFRDHSPRQLA